MYLYGEKFYPCEKKKMCRVISSRARPINTIVLGIGGNYKNTTKIFNKLFIALKNMPQVFYIKSTPILRNAAFGYTEQPDFDNALILIKTSMNLCQLYALIFYLERRFGRVRKREFKNASRSLDIDIIFFNKVILNLNYLTIPHEFWQERHSVCVPMVFL